MLKSLKTLSRVAAAIVALSSPALAQSYITGDVNLRTGPNKSYQSVGVLARGTAVNVYGCTPTGWCEVSTGANYGWASSRYIETYRQPAYAPIPQAYVPAPQAYMPAPQVYVDAPQTYVLRPRTVYVTRRYPVILAPAPMVYGAPGGQYVYGNQQVIMYR